jgi:putative PIN family toxin of toxin-antitoxin system
MIKAVVDTNVFISAIFWGGIPLEIVKLAFLQKISGVTSAEILEELEEKLLKKFGYPKNQTEDYILLIRKEFLVVEPKQKVSVVEDQKDNKIIEAALEANADFIVTGDTHLLKIRQYKNIRIVTPKEFLKKL